MSDSNEAAPPGTPKQASSGAQEPPAGKRTAVAWFFQIWGGLLEIVSFEWLLTRLRLPNGGGVILLRALLTAVVIYGSALGLRNFLDSDSSWAFSGAEFKEQVRGTLPWYGAIFGAVYAALYARFASQWTYLANVYNQIKAAECGRECNGVPLAQWKAGFIEDAEELHLAGKPLFASVLRAWGGDANVKAQFEANAPGGAPRFDALIKRVEAVWQRTAQRM